MEELVKKVEQWHVDRNLIDGASDKDQVLKLLLASSIQVQLIIHS